MFDSPYRRVAVAIDGSPASDAAIRLAFTVVCAGGEVAFLHATDRAATIAHYVAPWKSDIGALESMELFERGLFESACKRARALGFASSGHAIEGFTGQAIVNYVRSSGVDAVILGASGDQGIARTKLQSTAEDVLRAAGVPTFIVPSPRFSNKEQLIGRIMVAIDDSEPSARAIERAITLAQWTGAEIQFANVQECDFARRASDRAISTAACEQAARAGVKADAVIVHGSTAEALIAAAELWGADLIVVCTHGRIGRARLRYGSVAEAVVRSATCPVMVVPGGVPAARQEIAASA